MSSGRARHLIGVLSCAVSSAAVCPRGCITGPASVGDVLVWGVPACRVWTVRVRKGSSLLLLAVLERCLSVGRRLRVHGLLYTTLRARTHATGCARWWLACAGS